MACPQPRLQTKVLYSIPLTAYRRCRAGTHIRTCSIPEAHGCRNLRRVQREEPQELHHQRRPHHHCEWPVGKGLLCNLRSVRFAVLGYRAACWVVTGYIIGTAKCHGALCQPAVFVVFRKFVSAFGGLTFPRASWRQPLQWLRTLNLSCC